VLDEAAADAVIRRTLGHADAPERAAANVGSDLSPAAHRDTRTQLIAEPGPYEPELVEALYECLGPRSRGSARWTPSTRGLSAVLRLVAAGDRDDARLRAG